ncbi:O-antigen ligase family protein [Vibrio lentus]|uniref:O-antigen ligase-related domain-containing protein n=1 Tax=Vibrio lentus TaxID=136468 RepID=A0A855IQ47_9VIBR|nr:O-antigen ligase family protein [Vibrio lentus]PMJ65804.1 hypothetical protein BCU18_12700 [Vibrio lentus]PMM58015.1 hypothetical protein BCT50_22935 [Vibrio lentus]
MRILTSNLFIKIICFTVAMLLCIRGMVPYAVDGLVVALFFSYFIGYNFFPVISRSPIDSYLLGIWVLFFAFVLISGIYNNVDTFKFIFYFMFFSFFRVLFSFGKGALFSFVRSLSYVNCVICFFTIIAFFGILDIPQLLYTRGGSDRAYGLIGNPNYFSYLIFINFMLVTLFSHLFSKRVIIILLFIFLLAIISSLSRGVLIATLVFTVVYYGKRLSTRYLILTISVVIVSAFFFLSDPGNDRIMETISYRVDDLLNGGGSGRFEIWALGLEFITSKIEYIFFGVGPNQFGDMSKLLGIDNTTHNSYLRLLFELGILGLIVFILLIIYMFNSLKNIPSIYRYTAFFALMISWLSNDFILNKETWLFFAVLMTYNQRVGSNDQENV